MISKANIFHCNKSAVKQSKMSAVWLW